MTGRQRAQVSGSPGQHARLKGLLLATWPIFFVMLIAGYLLRSALPIPEIPQSVAGLMFIVLAILMVAFINGSERKLANFFKGAKGEETVARELAFLSSDYRVFNCVESGKEALLPSNGDYDHIVVGPSGVFLIETKNWSGTFTLENGCILYNGKKPARPPIEQVKSASSSLRSTLSEACNDSIEVKPIICFAANTFLAGTAGSSGVIVCNLRDLNSVISDSTDDRVASDIQSNASVFLNGLIS
jgi:hypothetical protein